jgi:hypothetical protein
MYRVLDFTFNLYFGMLQTLIMLSSFMLIGYFIAPTVAPRNARMYS